MDNHPKRPRDPAQLAKLMIDIASGEVEDREPAPSTEGKDAAAVELGRKGGLKGGKDRARILHLLCEGSAIRAVTRLTGASKKAVSRLLVDAGQAAAILHPFSYFTNLKDAGIAWLCHWRSGN